MICLESPAVHGAETFCLGSGSACRYAITFPPAQRRRGRAPRLEADEPGGVLLV
jgi:hypothetical protein